MTISKLAGAAITRQFFGAEISTCELLRNTMPPRDILETSASSLKIEDWRTYTLRRLKHMPYVGQGISADIHCS
jgi:hypothetical protein